MTESQAENILMQIAAAYTRFEITEDRTELWINHLVKMPYEPVLKNLNKHIAENKFPPTIAEISAKKPEQNEFLEKAKQWEKESRYASQLAKR